jgi:hypothetical protein
MAINLLYHRLIWQPGRQMRADWWTLLELGGWQVLYPHLPPRAMRSLDNEIQRRRESRGLLTVMRGEFTPLQKGLLRALERLPTLVLALGLLASQCPDYLLWRPYRQVLNTWLTEVQLNQLWSIWRGGLRTPDKEPAALLDFALLRGIDILQTALSGDPVWQAVRFTLPPASGEAFFSGEDTEALFLRLERFL